MNDLEYLHQISQANRPAKKERSLRGLLSSKIFKVAVIGVALLIFVCVVGSMLGRASGKEKDTLIRLNVRMNNLSSMIQTYNPNVKSPRLRAMAVSINTVLNESSKGIFNELVQNYGYSQEGENSEIQSEEVNRATEISLTLDRAKLNGVLDRTYLHQLVYEVSLLISLESEALERTGNAAIKQILQNSRESLNVYLEQLSGYSDSTN